MKRTLVVNMNYVDIYGDVLDVSNDDLGVIYNMYKDIEDELSIDYVDSENKRKLKGRKYDACTFFFSLNKIWSDRGKEVILKEVTDYLNCNGKIFFWDINKSKFKSVDSNIKILLPSGKIRGGSVINYNPLCYSNYEKMLKILEKYYIIEDTKVWNEMFFIQGRKK
ncbi:MAG: hypothetical protein GX275_14640 [Clostridiales bacterium]|nr:hypothetical protein [Clostridiales bacterium]